VVLYTNAAVMLNGVVGPALPAPLGLADAFALFGVFHTYEGINREVAVEAFSDAKGRWIAVDLDEIAPFPRGKRMTRLLSIRHLGTWAFPDLAAARRFLARKIRERVQRLHPDLAVSAVRVRSLTWPRGRDSYEQNQAEGKSVVVYSD